MTRTMQRTFVTLAVCLLWPSLNASANVDNKGVVTVPINGTETTIGQITATVGNAAGGFGSMNATFTMNATGSMLDNTNCTFDWFQILTNVAPNIPKAFNGKTLELPFVDPPFDGYQYQSVAGKPGDDEAPYYWNAAQYAANHVQGKTVKIDDTPGVRTLAFTTYLIERTPNYNPQTFDLIGGFTWGYTPDGKGGFTTNGPTFTSAGGGDALTADTAIANAFFDSTKWATTNARDMGPCLPVPEASTYVSFGLMLGGLLLLNARQLRARRRA